MTKKANKSVINDAEVRNNAVIKESEIREKAVAKEEKKQKKQELITSALKRAVELNQELAQIVSIESLTNRIDRLHHFRNKIETAKNEINMLKNKTVQLSIFTLIDSTSCEVKKAWVVALNEIKALEEK